MKRTLLLLLIAAFALNAGFAQKIFATKVDKTDLFLRGGPVVVGQLTVNAPVAGKVHLRFDGECFSDEGDEIVLAAANTPNWGANEKSVSFMAISQELNGNNFCHSRVYDVPAGNHVFYAVAENKGFAFGSGKADIYGQLTAEYFPVQPGGAFIQYMDIVKTDFNVEGPPVNLATQTISIPSAGKLVARFDGMSITSSGDLVMFAVNDNQFWVSYDIAASVEVYDDQFNHSTFTHQRVYDVPAGSYTFYALAQNNYEIYGNGIASVFGNFSISFYPQTDAQVLPQHTPVTQLGVDLEGAPVTIGQLQLNAPAQGKVLVNFAGTIVGSHGDNLRFGCSNQSVPDWSENCGSIGFKPPSSDRNRNSFSHSRLFEVGPGSHTFYAHAENVELFDGSGLAVTYADMTATFYPDNAVSTANIDVADNLLLSPNPVGDVLRIEHPEWTPNVATFTILNTQGQIISEAKIMNGASGVTNLIVNELPAGMYHLRVQDAKISIIKPFVKF